MNTKSNLLKSIFISLILVMGVSNAWAGSATIYVTGHIFKDSWDASKSEVRIAYNYNSNSGDKWTGHKSMTLTQYTYNGYPIYSYKVESSTNWAQIYFYHYKDGQHYNAQQQDTGGWTEFTNNNNKVYVGWIENDHRWVELCEDNTFYFLKNGKAANWTKLYAYAWSGSVNNNWPGTLMSNTGKTYNGTTIYSVKLYCTYATIIFNQSNGTNQSGNQATSGHDGKIFDYQNNNWLDYTYDVTVTFDANEHGTAPSAITVLKGNEVTAPTEPTAPGYTFEGWYKEAGCTNKWNFSTDVVNDNITLYAKWTKNVTTYKVTYGIHSSGGGKLTATANGAAITSGTDVEENQTIVFTATPDLGYQVEGWYSDVDCTAKLGNGYSISNENKICTISKLAKAETVYVKFKENTFDVTVTVNDAKGGTTEPSGLQSQICQVTGMNIAARVNSGYQFIGWDFVSGAGTFGAANAASTTFKPSQESTIRANYKANQYTITWDANGGTIDPTTSTYTYDGDPVALPTPKREGYTFNGWYTAKTDGKPIDNIGKDNKPTSNVTYYAQWTAITYTITLDNQGATTAGTTSVTATYDADMPSATMPTKTGYVFGGYYDQQNGQGTQYYKADGKSARTWNKAGNTTLYAYFVTPQIEVTLNGSTFEPGTASVTATATVAPAPADGTTSICWSLLYSGSGNEVAGHEPTPTYGNSVQFSIGDLAAGSYTIKAILREGTGCEGTEISSATQTFRIASNYTVTVKYMCGDQIIKTSITVPGHATEPKTLEADDIFGYTFKEWEAGDGVDIKTTSADNKTITYTAIYDGYLTAKYTKDNNIIYFNNVNLKWNDVYVYFYKGDFWNDAQGTGAVDSDGNGSYEGYIQMTKIEGTDIWYAKNIYNNISQIAFSPSDQNGKQYFTCAEAVRCWSFDTRLPMYVPIKAHGEKKNNTTTYYNKGYWMNYPENTGYTLRLFSKVEGDGTMDLASIPFEYSENKDMPMSIEVELGANQTYGFKIYSADDKWRGNNSIMTSNNSTDWEMSTDTKNCGLTTTIAGKYTFVINYRNTKNTDYNYSISVKFPGEAGDYRVIYTDNGTKNWSGTDRGTGWYHPSRLIQKKDVDTKETISFFVNHKKNPKLQIQKATIINGGIKWENIGEEIRVDINEDEDEDEDEDKGKVYNFTFRHAEDNLEYIGNIEPYTGNYYVRSYALDGKWNNYLIDNDNRMTYSAFSESEANSFGDKYSHYVTKFCEKGTNIKFTIANDYSPCITDTLIKDIKVNGNNPFDNLDNDGTIKNDDKYKANVRFMWNRTTNRISRAYIGPAGDEVADRQFLILKAEKEIKNSTGGTLSNNGDDHDENQAIFSDTQNWIYERTIQVQPKTRVKLYACYPEVNVANAQYFRGTYDNNNATWNDNNSVQILGGEGTSWNTIRVIYDFKTNRLMAAWIPSGEINEAKSIEADMMILRRHQEDAQCVTFNNDNSKLTNIKTVYGVMRFNRWILNNRANPDDLNIEHCTRKDGNQTVYDEKTTDTYHPVLALNEQVPTNERGNYFISFPFEVHLSDVFGFGQYGTHWIISNYNGLRRAQRGFFIDNCVNEDCTNWDYIWDPDDFVLEANKGYLLSLDLDLMKHDNTSFWAHNTGQVELFFPSTVNVKTIEKTNYQMDGLSDDYICNINYNKDGNNPEGDRRVKDTYWRCIGVPSFANYDGSLYKTATDAENEENAINWKDDYTWQADYSGFPFLYEWNTADNSITPVSTQKYPFRPTFAYLVQNGNPIYWSAVNTKPSKIVARRLAADEVKNYEWKLTLSRNEQVEDQAFVRLSDDEQITTEFDFNQDLSKEFNYGRSDIYTLIGYEKAAANSLPLSEQTTLIPLGLSIEYNSDYTIAMPGRMENIGVTLIDTESNTRTNLSAGMEYTLTLKKGDYNNRFFIEISPIQQTPTDIEYVTGDSNSQDSVRKVLIDNILYIVRDGQIFDARGARVQ